MFWYIFPLVLLLLAFSVSFWVIRYALLLAPIAETPKSKSRRIRGGMLAFDSKTGSYYFVKD